MGVKEYYPTGRVKGYKICRITMQRGCPHQSAERVTLDSEENVIIDGIEQKVKIITNYFRCLNDKCEYFRRNAAEGI